MFIRTAFLGDNHDDQYTPNPKPQTLNPKPQTLVLQQLRAGREAGSGGPSRSVISPGLGFWGVGVLGVIGFGGLQGLGFRVWVFWRFWGVRVLAFSG